jgi:hypothetical protein
VATFCRGNKDAERRARKEGCSKQPNLRLSYGKNRTSGGLNGGSVELGGNLSEAAFGWATF